MSESFQVRANRFLEAYAKLCEETGVRVEGCGCCDSPFLSDVRHTLSRVQTAEEQQAEHIEHLRKQLDARRE